MSDETERPANAASVEDGEGVVPAWPRPCMCGIELADKGYAVAHLFTCRGPKRMTDDERGGTDLPFEPHIDSEGYLRIPKITGEMDGCALGCLWFSDGRAHHRDCRTRQVWEQALGIEGSDR